MNGTSLGHKHYVRVNKTFPLGAKKNNQLTKLLVWATSIAASQFDSYDK